MSIIEMAKLKLELPPHCQVKSRKNGEYHDVYFMPHPKDRPDGWRPTFHLGRTDRDTPETIKQKAQELFKEFEDFRAMVYGGQDTARRKGTILDVIDKYKKSRFWTDLSPRTRLDYDYYLKEIEEWSAAARHPHIKDMSSAAVVKWLNRYDDRPVAQRRAKTVLSLVYKVAIREGLVESNIVNSISLYRRNTEKRELVIWEEKDVAAFIAKADEMGQASVGRALIMGLETAQRRGDVLKMQKPRDYDPKEGRLKFTQSKTGKMVNIKATERLKAALAAVPAEQLPLFVNEKTGKPWQEHTFTHVFREIADMAGLKNHIFMHTRHSAILYLHRAGVDQRGIASITGHSLKTVGQMLENHYLETRDQEVADKAIAQLEKYRVRQKSKTRRQTK